jgi:iron complex transport system substrate-binding protein
MLVGALLLAGMGTSCRASRVVTDETGRTVTVPDHPHRVISLAPSITDDVFALGAGDDVAGVTDYVMYPEEARPKPSVGSIRTPSAETMLALKPDLILASPRENQKAMLDQMQRLGVPVFLVAPHGLAGILKSIGFVGVALHREAEAGALNARLQQRIDAVRASVRGKPVVSVFMPVWYDPVITIGKGAFITEIVAAAGGRSVTDDLEQEWPHVSLEIVLERAPETLLLVKGGKVTLDVLAVRPGWSQVPAVKSRSARYVDRRVDLASPVAIDALEDLAKELHP